MRSVSIMKLASVFILGLSVVQTASAAFSLKVNERVFNDFPNSNLVTTTGPGSVQFAENTYGTGGWANRHDAVATADSGVSNRVFGLNESVSITADVTLSPTDAAAEAGLRINSPITGDVIFLIKDNGEIAAFGGGAAFHSFTAPAVAGDPMVNPYIPGSTVTMTINYTPSGALLVPGTIEYILDRGAGPESSGVQAFSNLEGGPLQFTAGMYTQNIPSLPLSTSAVTTSFNNVTIVPEPASLALLGLGGLAMLRRRQA